jgi:hypothetical protein
MLQCNNAIIDTEALDVKAFRGHGQQYMRHCTTSRSRRCPYSGIED